LEWCYTKYKWNGKENVTGDEHKILALFNWHLIKKYSWILDGDFYKSDEVLWV
jgi:hypothetical protein